MLLSLGDNFPGLAVLRPHSEGEGLARKGGTWRVRLTPGVRARLAGRVMAARVSALVDTITCRVPTRHPYLYLHLSISISMSISISISIYMYIYKGIYIYIYIYIYLSIYIYIYIYMLIVWGRWRGRSEPAQPARASPPLRMPPAPHRPDGRAAGSSRARRPAPT